MFANRQHKIRQISQTNCLLCRISNRLYMYYVLSSCPKSTWKAYFLFIIFIQCFKRVTRLALWPVYHVALSTDLFYFDFKTSFISHSRKNSTILKMQILVAGYFYHCTLVWVILSWLIDWLMYWLTDWLIVWLIHWLVDWLIDWPTDWLMLNFHSTQ